MLLLTNVTEEDSGQYTCRVSNYIGEVSQSGWLTVLPGKTKNETLIPGVPSPFCWYFGLFFCRRGDPGIFAEPLWCGSGVLFSLFFWWIFPGAPAIQPISHGNKPLVCHCHCLPVLFCVNFPCLFFPFLYHFPLFSLLAKGSGLFSMFLHLCLHGPLRI